MMKEHLRIWEYRYRQWRAMRYGRYARPAWFVVLLVPALLLLLLLGALRACAKSPAPLVTPTPMPTSTPAPTITPTPTLAPTP
ncbi:MAG: hypothetical protein Q4E65_10415, partial [Clostridia bacterium]|nr:hypothetical protein [Clostridia bacterium]